MYCQMENYYWNWIMATKVYYDPTGYELGQTVTIGTEEYCIQVNADGKPIKIVKVDDDELTDGKLLLELIMATRFTINCQIIMN